MSPESKCKVRLRRHTSWELVGTDGMGTVQVWGWWAGRAPCVVGIVLGGLAQTVLVAASLEQQDHGLVLEKFGRTSWRRQDFSCELSHFASSLNSLVSVFVPHQLLKVKKTEVHNEAPAVGASPHCDS